MSRDGSDFNVRFWETLCQFQLVLVFLLTVALVFLVFIVFSFAIGTDPVGKAVLQISLVFDLLLLVGVLYCLRSCSRLERG